ncbi:tetratricopeptide repeat-containing sensor histidine kinase [Cellulophaga lytica]|uniref:Oxygen sensor histidine kinase NreB n=1 Tax=Cellulophaga lytica (strain ATCC 23178 / DSM 7489 / JCM 8516 / NBRC 14961 / NCIMB 1423 / VKM B-1433 / Cy l20) TaxID=867900 RepID=F0RDU1_CELLC|nr:sensor histidine kinase [Cellulophaga lytica]ADY29852.1 histidine kinase [Cellulophaga lytica DSM 7489]AIM60851.1 histidine kinase [Cellulophaga lytica]WQG75982.1 sensor histidine kinase [Cellulophaga lytica]
MTTTKSTYHLQQHIKFKHILVFLLIGVFQFANAQEADSIKKEEDPSFFSFSWSKIQKDKTLQPLYDALKDADFGAQRFSIFDQLIDHHAKKANTDSVLHYGNLYVQELGNWDKPEKEKKYLYAKAYYLMSLGSSLNGLVDKSIEWNIKGLQEAEAINDSEYMYLHKVSLAKNYIAQNSIDKAINLLKESISIYGKQQPTITYRALLQLGNAYSQKKEYDIAKNYYNSSLELAKQFKDLEAELEIKLHNAKLLEVNKEYNKAIQMYAQISNQAKAKNFNAIYYEGALLVAKLYYKLEEYNIANVGLTMAYINAVDHENLQFQRESLIIQARSFYKQEDYKNAYATMTQLFGVLNEIKDKQQREIIKELEIQYETIKKEQAISDLKEDQIKQQAELDRQKTIKAAFLIGFLVILIPVIALLYTYYQKMQAQSELAKKNEEINSQKVAALKQEQELKLIKAAIEGQDEERKRIAQELHDSIGGNLAGIKLQLASVKEKTQTLNTISGQLDETYQLVRDISHTLIPKKFRQDDFTQLIKEYTKSITSTGKLNVEFHPHPEDKINTLNEIVKMELFKIIQELMTNTLKHAKASTTDIHLNYFEDSITLLFEDNGKGFDTSKNGEGIGFKNIKSRIEKLNGTLHVDSAINRGTVVSIEIPIKNTTNDNI